MRYKPVPTPVSVDTLSATQAAVPLVPGSTDDCCARIVDRTTVESREAARAWLTFLEALELVETTDAGYVRSDRDPTDPAVATAFEDRVYAASEVLAAVRSNDGPVSVAAVVDAVELTPRWEQHRSPTPSNEWRDRVEAILAWATVFGLVTRTTDGYTPTDGSG